MYSSSKRYSYFLSKLPSFASVLTIVLATLVLVGGYALGYHKLNKMVPGFAATKANTAIMLILAGVSLFLISREHRKIQLIGQIIGVILFSFALLTFVQVIFSFDFGIDELFFYDPIENYIPGFPPGRVGASVSLCLTMLGYLSIVNGKFKRNHPLQLIPSLLVFLVAFVNLFSGAYNFIPKNETLVLSQLSFISGVSFLFLGLGHLFLNPELGIANLILAKDEPSKLFKQAVLYIVFLPGLLVAVIYNLIRTEALGLGISITLFIIIYALVGLIAIWNYAVRIRQFNQVQIKAQQELSDSNIKLQHSLVKQQEQSKLISSLLQQSLAESEENYKKLFESQPLPVFVYSLNNYNFLAVNKVALLKYGYTKEEFLSLNLKDIRPEEDWDGLKRLVSLANIKEEMQNLGVIRHKDKSGRVFYVEAINHVIEYEGEPARIAVINDVTNRLQSERRLEGLAESIQMIFFEVDKNLNYTFLNRYCQNYLQMDKSRLLGRNLLEIFPFYEGTEFLATIYKTIETQKAHTFEMTAEIAEQVSYFEVDMFPTVEGVAILSKDITQKKKTEFDLQESREFTDSVLQAIPSYIYLYDLVKDEVVFANDALNQMLGLPYSEVLGSKKVQIMAGCHPENRVMLDDFFNGNYPDDENYIRYVEYRTRDSQGNYRWVGDRSIVYARDKNGRPKQILGSITSIDEEKKIKLSLIEAKVKAEDASMAKTNFLANMSHELRNPLNALSGISQLLERDFSELDPRLKQYIDLMKQSNTRLLAIIGDILDLSKIEANKISVNPKQINVSPVITSIVSSFEPLASKKGIEVFYENENDTFYGLIDEQLFTQIINNLLSNAIKFTMQGRITVRLKYAYKEAKMLQLSVSDTGIGMNDDFVKNKLFTVFEQESAGMAKSYDGTGLGLHLVKRFTELMGGTIEVQSAKNIGTKFTLYFQA